MVVLMNFTRLNGGSLPSCSERMTILRAGYKSSDWVPHEATTFSDTGRSRQDKYSLKPGGGPHPSADAAVDPVF